MTDNVKYGFWTIPVGKVLDGQGVLDGLKQKIFEETNLTVEDCKEIVYKEIEYIRRDKPVKVFTHIFEITKYSGKLKNKEPHKHRQQMFMSVDEISKLKYLSDTTIMYLNTLGIKRENKI